MMNLSGLRMWVPQFSFLVTLSADRRYYYIPSLFPTTPVGLFLVVVCRFVYLDLPVDAVRIV